MKDHVVHNIFIIHVVIYVDNHNNKKNITSNTLNNNKTITTTSTSYSIMIYF